MNRIVPTAQRLPQPAAAPPAPVAAPNEPWYAEAPTGPDWRRVIAAVLRYKWLMLGITVAGTGGAALVAHSLHQPYVASATIWIDQGATGQRSTTTQPVQMLDPEAWLDLLRSYTVLDQAIRQLGLYLEPVRRADSAAFRGLGVAEQFRPGRYKLTRSGDSVTLSTDEGVTMDRAAAGDSIGRSVGLRWAPSKDAVKAGDAVPFALVTPRDAARRLGEALETRIDRMGNFLHVDLQGTDPRATAAIVNAVVHRYVEVAADLKRQKVTELGRILDSQVNYAEANLRSAESAYAGFRVHAVTQPGDRPALPAGAGGPAGDPLADSYFRGEVDRASYRRDRDALQRALAQAGDSGVTPEVLDVIPSAQKDAELAGLLDTLRSKQASLRALRLRYADAYQPVQRLDGEVSSLRRELIPAAARRVITELGSRETQLASQSTQTAQALRAAPPRAVEEARLQRALSAAQDLYASVRQRDQETKLAEASSISDVRVLDAAVVPQRPIRNTAPRFLALGFLGSFGLALVGVIVLDRVDPRVRYPEQVSEGLGLTILGAVPHLTGRESQNGNGTTTAAVIEALRGIRLNLLYAMGTDQVVITITSPGSGDGKSFLTANLGLSFAEAGYKTLVIDGDIRRGVLHRGLGGRRRPGLVDVLMDEAVGESVIQATPYQNLSLIASGARRRDAPEKLSSPSMNDLMERLRSEYQVILCDSPPLTAGIDPYTLAALTGRVMLVLRTGVSRRELTGIKLQVFQRLPVRLIGAVLNDVPLGNVYQSYSYYLPGYESADEKDALPPRRIL